MDVFFINSRFVMFSGPFAMIFYGVQIFQETGEQPSTNPEVSKTNFKIQTRHFLRIRSGSIISKTFSKTWAGVNAHMAAVVVAILRVVGGLVAIVLIKKLPR